MIRRLVPFAVAVAIFTPLAWLVACRIVACEARKNDVAPLRAVPFMHEISEIHQ